MWWRRLRYALLMVGLCAIATCPAAQRSCRARQRAREADHLLNVLGDRVAEIVAKTGRVPPVPAGPTPTTSCCDQGGTCAPDAATWDSPGWRALQFTIDGAYRYTYQYTPAPDGRSAVLRATGDVDCDGKLARYELKLTIDLQVQGTRVHRTWHRTDPYE
jgi:hypothetical protein